MKKLVRNSIYTISILIFFAGCKKDIGRLQLDTTNPTVPKLTATESNIVLMESREANTAIIFNWTKPSFNFNGSFKYTLQFAQAGTNFASPVNESAGTDLTKVYTEKAFNALILSLGIAPGTEGNIDIRIQAVLNDSIEALYSNVTSITVTPYTTDQFLYVPGAYQGWDPASADIIRSIEKNNKYEGYIYFPDAASIEFKVTDAPDWDHVVYGDSSGGASGKITIGGDNFTVPAPGYYKINVDLVNNTWTATQTNWGLIGSATPNGWDSDQDLVYDPTAKTWSITLDLIVGEIKFRANDDWALNLGDDGANGFLEYNGANIPIAAAGNYTITLNLSDAAKYTYTVKKN